MLAAVRDEIAAWITAIVFSLPGKIGQSARVIWCRLALKGWGKGSRAAGSVHLCGCRNIAFGANCHIGANSFFFADGGAIRVGDNSTFNTGVHINASGGAEIVIGNNCLLGPNVVLRTATHNFDDVGAPIREQGHKAASIILEDDVWVAANAVILPGVRLGRGSVIGAGSVVTRSTEPMTVSLGAPAQMVRARGARP
jgi:galactoside O-acetyltransferase